MTYCNVLWYRNINDKHLVVLSRHNSYAPIERFFCLPLKAIEFNGVDTTDFLRNVAVSMYLFIFVDF